jgi:flagella basal body P-ring formation protein FlgA
MLTDGALGSDTGDGLFASSRAQLVGKVARRTLLPGHLIPLRAVDNPRAIRNGAAVELVYIDGGLTIVTTGAALQDGAVGDLVKIRNEDSGVTVSGRVQPDGTVRVNGG